MSYRSARRSRNTLRRPISEQVCRDYGYQPPLIGTPIELRREDEP